MGLTQKKKTGRLVRDPERQNRFHESDKLGKNIKSKKRANFGKILLSHVASEGGRVGRFLNGKDMPKMIITLHIRRCNTLVKESQSK